MLTHHTSCWRRIKIEKDALGPKGLSQIGSETLVSWQVKRFSDGFQKPTVVVRKEEIASYIEHLTRIGLSARLVVDENRIGPPSSLLAAINAVAKTCANNMGSSTVIHKRGLLVDCKAKESMGVWRWTGTVIMPFEVAERITASTKLLPQIVALSNCGMPFKVIKEPGQSINVNTVVDLREANRLFGG